MRCKASEQTIRASLEGNYRAEHLFALRQSLELYDFYQSQITCCDKEIERVLQALAKSVRASSEARPSRDASGLRPMRQSSMCDGALYALLGVDITQIHGLGPYMALKLIAECGTDMTRWPSVKHFTSWLTLAPGSKISGGKVLSSKTRRSTNRAASLLRLAASAVGKTDTALGAFYRRLSARVGKAKALTATARKIAVLFYNTLRFGLRYVDPGVRYYEERYRQRVVASLRRRAQALGFVLQESSVPTGGVS